MDRKETPETLEALRNRIAQIKSKEIRAEITRDLHHSPKVSRVGTIVTLLRSGARNDVWVKLPDGSEIVWKLTYMKLLE